MAYKRSRATYEADLQAQQSPYVIYGTPLPPLDPDVRDDGSYVPVWKQEVTDERGRKRLHGAFTGGFSAGYFNTVGSKEGWTPSTFVSSRGNKTKDAAPTQQKPEDFMDEEDLADAEEARKLHTADSFAGLGSTEEDISRRGSLMDVLKVSGDIMGVKLLRKMGWRDGQGVGPKVRRKARLDDGDDLRGGDGPDTHLFAPENSQMISFVRKNDHKGLGFEGEGRLSELPSADGNQKARGALANDEEDGIGVGTLRSTQTKKKKPAVRGGLGVGILNDTGSDDEDPYHVGPQVSYNRVIGGDKKKKKTETNKSTLGAANPLLGAKPVFISKKAAKSKASSGFRRCHDGRLPLDGFVLSANLDPLSSIQNQDGKYPPPEIPPDWKSSKSPASTLTTSNYQSTASAAASSNHDPKSRASLLGETPLPGKSVFDYLPPTARSRIASATGNSNLPLALSEAPPPGYTPSAASAASDLASLVPTLPRETALTALGRGPGGWMPYAEDPSKRVRYRTFLETRAGTRDGLPDRAENMSTDDWVKEMHEFAHAAQLFKPMTGTMASRFTSASSTTVPPPDPAPSTTTAPATSALLSRPADKPADPATQAARLGMFGPLTRSTAPFAPTRLLCKRFNVPPPSHVQGDPSSGAADEGGRSRPAHSEALPGRRLELVGGREMEGLMRERDREGEGRRTAGEAVVERVVQVDPERNEALEAERAGEAVFQAVFGSESEGE
ncbi:G-patch domain [Lasallia pustulata]|uniref:G-patch domain n=1 Tax=Lasallia pustulata TaxID=136370 RepID=A0A1W5D740_9LECA|nr:G-patch domain [Lasallia pustulata]